jgi:hypothetical protein
MCLKRERVEDLDCLSEVNGPERSRSVFISPWPSSIVYLTRLLISSSHTSWLNTSKVWGMPVDSEREWISCLRQKQD